MLIKKILLTMLIGGSLALATASAASASPWGAHHPRRAEVNHRLSHQDARINHDLRAGRITARQAHYLHREDRSMRGQERFDAHFDGGHITRPEKRALNQEENGVSRQIYRDAH